MALECAFLAPYGLTHLQFSILHHLAYPHLQAGNRISDFARAVEVRQPVVTKTIAKLQNVELVEDWHDKRVWHVHLLPKVGQVVTQIRQATGPNLFNALNAIDFDKYENFAIGLKQLGRWLDKNRV